MIVQYFQALLGLIAEIGSKLATYGEAIGEFFVSIFKLIDSMVTFFGDVPATNPLHYLGFLCTVGVAFIAFRIVAHFL